MGHIPCPLCCSNLQQSLFYESFLVSAGRTSLSNFFLGVRGVVVVVLAFFFFYIHGNGFILA